MALDALRRQIAIIPQDPVLFSGERQAQPATPLAAVCKCSLTSCCCCCPVSCAAVPRWWLRRCQTDHAYICRKKEEKKSALCSQCPPVPGHCKPSLPPKSVRPWIVVFCFDAGSLRSNLDVRGVLPDERLWEALKEAQLSPAVSALGGLDAQIQVNVC